MYLNACFCLHTTPFTLLSSPRHQPSNINKMGPKKNADKFRIKPEKCQYHDSRYCKFGDKCNTKQYEDVCNDKNCTGSNCDKRLPNPCKKECSYSHVTFPLMMKI